MSAVVLLVAGVSEASTNRTPRFSVSTTSAIPGDDVVVRIDRASTSHALIRLYLIRQEDVRSVHSRFDPRVNFVGFIAGGSHAQLLFTMPSLQPGRYELAYWCRTCFRRSTGIGVERTKLEIDPPISSGCQATTPNGNAPPVSGAWTGFHGAGRLWVLLPRTGTLEFPTGNGDILFDKMLWVGHGADPTLNVEYRRLDVPSPPHTAVTVSGTLSGYTGPSWASRMYFQPGCWLVAGHTPDAALSFVVQVLLES